MATLRFQLLFGIALLAAAGCAQQPVRTDHTSPAAAPTAAASGAASTRLLASAYPPRLLVFAYDQGWRQLVTQGNNDYFCRTDVPSGSLIPLPRCVTESQLESIRVTVQQQHEHWVQPIPYIPIRYP